MKKSQAFTLLPPAILCLFAGLEQLFNFSRGYASLPFALSLFFVGLPHGALDLRLLRQLTLGHRRFAAVEYMFRYLFTMIATAVTLLYSPLFIICLFGLLSAWHFGTADWSYRASGKQRTQKYFWIISRGLLVISVPLWWHPEPSAIVIERLTSILGRQQSINPAVISSLAATALAACLVCYAGAVWRERDTRALLQDAGEAAAIVVSATLLHPMFFVGLYFLVWHSWKHMGQLDEFGELGFADLGRPSLRIARGQSAAPRAQPRHDLHTSRHPDWWPHEHESGAVRHSLLHHRHTSSSLACRLHAGRNAQGWSQSAGRRRCLKIS